VLFSGTWVVATCAILPVELAGTGRSRAKIRDVRPKDGSADTPRVAQGLGPAFALGEGHHRSLLSRWRARRQAARASLVVRLRQR